MRTRSHSRRFLTHVLVVLAAVSIVSLPSLANAQRGDADPAAERAAVRARKAEVASQVDALKASDAEVSAALADLEANVQGQEARLAEAERAAAAAADALKAATDAVDAKRAEIDELRQQIREFAVEAFIHPPKDDAMAALNADDPSDSAEKRALLELQNESDSDLLDQLSAAEEDLAVKQAQAEQAKAAADAKQAEVETRLAEVSAARDQQAAFLADIEARLDHKLSEAANLAAMDKKLSEQIRKQQEELARQAAAARARSSSRSSSGRRSVSGPVNIGPGPGGLSTVSCPGGGSITVASSVAGNVQAMLQAAAADGVSLCGSGYRDPQRTAELRIINGCPDVYSSPASSCRVPTARPGSSMHEQGLAIDFDLGRDSGIYGWLSGHAGSYGFQNLPSEAWHWSTNGN